MEVKNPKKVHKIWKQMIKLAKSMNQDDDDDNNNLNNEMKLLKRKYKFLVTK